MYLEKKTHYYLRVYNFCLLSTWSSELYFRDSSLNCDTYFPKNPKAFRAENCIFETEQSGCGWRSDQTTWAWRLQEELNSTVVYHQFNELFHKVIPWYRNLFKWNFRNVLHTNVNKKPKRFHFSIWSLPPGSSCTAAWVHIPPVRSFWPLVSPGWGGGGQWPISGLFRDAAGPESGWASQGHSQSRRECPKQVNRSEHCVFRGLETGTQTDFRTLCTGFFFFFAFEWWRCFFSGCSAVGAHLFHKHNLRSFPVQGTPCSTITQRLITHAHFTQRAWKYGCLIAALGIVVCLLWQVLSVYKVN